MSFNFSDDDDDDDDDDLDLDAYDDTGLLALASRERAENFAVVGAATSAPPAPDDARSGSGSASDGEVPAGGGGDWDDVDWEDADEEDEDGYGADGQDPLRTFPARGVTIHFGSAQGMSNDPDEGTDEKGSENNGEEGGNDEEKQPSKKRKRKATTRVLRSVPHETRRMVRDVRRAQMLCDVSRCVRCSFACGSIDDDDGAGGDDRWLLSHVAHSLIPQEVHPSQGRIPTKRQLAQFARWFFQFVNRAEERRRDALRRNVAQGATALARLRSLRRRGRRTPGANGEQSAEVESLSATKHPRSSHPSTSGQNLGAGASAADLLRTIERMAPRYDDDPQLLLEEEGVDTVDDVERTSSRQKVLLCLAMARSLGWRARYVASLRPLPLELTVDHPLLKHASPFESQPMLEFLDVKPPANAMMQQSALVRKLLRFVREGGMSKVAGVAGRKRRKTKRDNAKASTAAAAAIDLVSSGSEDETNGKSEKKSPPCACPSSFTVEDEKEGLLSWVEVLCLDDNATKQRQSPSKRPAAGWVPIHPEQESLDKPEEAESILAWMERHGREGQNENGARGGKRRGRRGGRAKWPSKGPDLQRANEYARKSPVSYVLAVEHLPPTAVISASNKIGARSQMKGVRLTDVTPRYANSWSRTLRLRGATGKDITAGRGKCVDGWWEASLKRINRHYRPEGRRREGRPSMRLVMKTRTKSGREVDVLELESSEDSSDSDEDGKVEARELTGSKAKEKIPTSKAAFKQSPFYVIPSVLGARDVLHPDARKRIAGVFKGEMVYRRSDTSRALRVDKWPYQGRKVKEEEMGRPAKRVKARKKPAAKGFRALSSYGVSEKAQDELISSIDEEKKNACVPGMDDLYGVWQTEPWSPPPVGPVDAIPTNPYKNVELALINPGLTHVDLPRLAPIARKLGVPYAPCMLGYEGHGGNRAPTIRGIVVHNHNVEVLQEAYAEWEGHLAEKEREERRNMILKRWKRLVVGIMTKDRLDREYG